MIKNIQHCYILQRDTVASPLEAVNKTLNASVTHFCEEKSPLFFVPVCLSDSDQIDNVLELKSCVSNFNFRMKHHFLPEKSSVWKAVILLFS